MTDFLTIFRFSSYSVSVFSMPFNVLTESDPLSSELECVNDSEDVFIGQFKLALMGEQRIVLFGISNRK